MPLTALRRRPRILMSLIALCLVLTLFLGGGAWIGLFSTVGVDRGTVGPYLLVGVDHRGSLRAAPRLREQEVQPALRNQQLTDLKLGPPAALVDDRYLRMPRGERHSVVGYLVLDPSPNLQVKPPLVAVPIPRREVITARIDAHRSVATYKAYRAIRERQQAALASEGLMLTSPSLEIEHHADRIEVQVPTAPLK